MQQGAAGLPPGATGALARTRRWMGTLASAGGGGYESSRRLGKWLLVGTAIGLVAGAGAIFFTWAIHAVTVGTLNPAPRALRAPAVELRSWSATRGRAALPSARGRLSSPGRYRSRPPVPARCRGARAPPRLGGRRVRRDPRERDHRVDSPEPAQLSRRHLQHDIELQQPARAIRTRHHHHTLTATAPRHLRQLGKPGGICHGGEFRGDPARRS